MSIIKKELDAEENVGIVNMAFTLACDKTIPVS